MRVFALLLMIFAGMASVQAGESLYDRMGQKEAMARIASRLVDYSVADPRIEEAFAQTNIPRLKGLLTLFFCKTTGGPCTYPGRDMAAAHKEIGIRDVHFNALVENLQRALSDEGIGFATQNEFLALLAAMHGDVVNR
ncbi:Group 1 truncated hemoglobin GlbN [Alphaproteobacteria bacterium SO-S41]|nr:Group 1 truncated hemoglobin GlbN [Alphaproteobacteria bacterium SO-S41]